MAMIETLKERVNDDPALVRRGRFLTTTFLLEVGATSWLIAIYEGRILSVTRGPFVMPSSSFALHPPLDQGHQVIGARRRVLRAEGDLKIFMANLRYFKEALAKL